MKKTISLATALLVSLGITACSSGGGSNASPSVTQPAVKQPEAKQPEAKQPEAKQPEAKQPEAKQPEAKQPEVKQPEVKQPEVKQPEVKQPEIKQPEIKQPEIKQPEVKQPEVKQPEIKQPEIKQPEVKQPEVKQPEAKQPEVKQPEVKQPETKQPEVKQPEVKQPETKQPVVIVVEGKSLPHIPRKRTDDEDRHSNLGITRDHYHHHITDFSGQEKDSKVYRLPVMTKDNVKIGDYYFVNQAYSTYGMFRADDEIMKQSPNGNADLGDKYPDYYQGKPTYYTADLVQAGGKATYHGYAIHRPEIGSPEYNVGNFKLDADFKEKTVTGYISDVKDFENIIFKGNIRDYSETEKMVGFKGKSQDSGFSGAFMGPNAEEVVGSGGHKGNLVFGGKC